MKEEGTDMIIHVQQSQGKGCDPWRLGVPSIHSLDGTKHHPVVTPGLYHFFYCFLISKIDPTSINKPGCGTDELDHGCATE